MNVNIDEVFAAPESSPATKPQRRTVRDFRRWSHLAFPVIIVGVPFLLGQLAPDSIGQFMFSRLLLPFLLVLTQAIWLLTDRWFSWGERLTAVGVLAAGTALTSVCMHPSMNVMSILMYGAPALVIAWSLWLFCSGGNSGQRQVQGLVAIVALVSVVMCAIRSSGVTGNFSAEFDWRWRPSSEEKLIAAEAGKGKPPVTEASAEAAKLELQPGDWPEFRGTRRDGVVTGVRLRTDWAANPPKELWRTDVGPGWSSFSVVQGRVFTQEQLGTEERVVCRDAENGKVLWIHSVQTRFEESVAGAGPRATPTFSDGWLYVQGANGHVECLNAATGSVRWSEDVAKTTKAPIPQWGFSASPLVHNGLVTVFAGGEGKELITLDAETGKPVWTAGNGTLSYCSAQLSQISGESQILFCTNLGVSSYEPATGKLLWTNEWPVSEIARIVQPCVLESGDVLIGTGLGIGLRRIHVSGENGKWSAQEVWTTNRCKPYFNDYVVHDEHLYGIDGEIFVCVSLKDGRIVWRTRGYGSGQVLLVKDQAMLVILSETGELALVKATPEKHDVVAKIQAIEGKTWNHPVLAHGRLYVRNGAEAACYDVAEASEAPKSVDAP